MRMVYTFAAIPQLQDVRLTIENRGRRLRFSLSGPRAWLYRPLLWYYFVWHSRLGVLSRFNGANVYSLYIPPIPSHAHNRLLETFLSTWYFRRPLPMAMTLAVSGDCQLKCRHCSVSRNPAPPRPLELAEIKRAIAESLRLGVTNITFTGGEPLLRPDLEACIAAVPPEQALALVFTNALALTPQRIASLKKAGLFGLQISIDSPQAEEHDRWRGREGVFAHAAEAIRTAVGAGLMVGVSTYASNESVAEKKLSRLAELAADWGVHELSVFDIMPSGLLLRQPQVMLGAENRARLLKEARTLNRRLGNKPRIITQSWTNSGRGFSRFIGCLAGHYQFHISANGDFQPCDFTPLSAGNVRCQSVPDLWDALIRHPAYRRRRQGCRMQDAAFRRDYIDAIPVQADLPFPLDRAPGS